MEISFEVLNNLVNQIQKIEDLPISQIPNIDLYIDQVTTFMEDNLSGYLRDDADKIMTKTMVNNYTKDKVLPPPEKKKYSKHHIILLILVFHLKQSLSILDIQKLVETISGEDSQKIYEIFTELQKAEKEVLLSSVTDKWEKAGKKIKELALPSTDDEMQVLLTTLSLIMDANIKKQLACKIIDNWFSSAPRT